MNKFVALFDSSRSSKRERHRCRLEGVNFVRIPPQVMRVAVNHLERVATTSATLYMKLLIVQLEDKEVAWFHLHEAGWRRKHKLYQRFNTAENSAPRTNFTSLYNTLDAFQSVFWARTRQRITFSHFISITISLSPILSRVEWAIGQEEVSEVGQCQVRIYQKFARRVIRGVERTEIREKY